VPCVHEMYFFQMSMVGLCICGGRFWAVARSFSRGSVERVVGSSLKHAIYSYVVGHFLGSLVCQE